MLANLLGVKSGTGAALIVVAGTASVVSARAISESPCSWVPLVSYPFYVSAAERLPSMSRRLVVTGVSSAAAEPIVEASGGAADVRYSKQARKFIGDHPELSSPLTAALERLGGIFSGDFFEVAADAGMEDDERERLAVAVVTHRTAAEVQERLRVFDEWWVELEPPADFDVWVRHV